MTNIAWILLATNSISILLWYLHLKKIEGNIFEITNKIRDMAFNIHVTTLKNKGVMYYRDVDYIIQNTLDINDLCLDIKKEL